MVDLVLAFNDFSVHVYCISKLKFWNKRFSVLNKLCVGEHVMGKNLSTLTGVVSLVEHLILASVHLYSCLGMCGKYLMIFPLFSTDSVCNKAEYWQVMLQYQVTLLPKMCMISAYL